MMPMIKNLEHESIFTLSNICQIREHEVVSRTIAQNENVSLTLFAFDLNEEISTHASSGDAMVQILSGCARITIDGKEYEVQAGESIVMSAGLPHALYAMEPFKMLLTVVFPTTKGEN